MKELCCIRTLILALSIASFGPTAGAVDITGTWEGKEICSCFNSIDGKYKERFSDLEMLITQDNEDLNILVFGELFNGILFASPTNSQKGEAAFINCDTDPKDNTSFGELARAILHTKPNGWGKIKIDSIWSRPDSQICTCSMNFERINTSDVSVDGCPG